MNAFERHATAEPSADQRSRALRNLVIGCVIGIVVGKVVEGVLDRETLMNPLWVYGRYATVVLFGWIGWLAGLGRERVVSENIESLAIAVVMALILKYFLLEAYKIPTGSMQPTILGNESAGIFDRVLVNKFAYLIDDPKRYDVVVFKYPLNRTQNYIKRCVGIGPEQVTVHNGNIYTAPQVDNGRYGERTIARKPDDVRESVLKTLFPSKFDGETFAKAFTVTSGTFTEDDGTIEFEGAAKCRFKKDGESILDHYLDGYDPAWGIGDDRIPASEREYVGDLAIDFEVEPKAGTTEVVVTIVSNGLGHVATLGVGEGTRVKLASGSKGDADDTPISPLPGRDAVEIGDLASPLRAGKSTHVAFWHVDQEIVLELDGEVAVRVPYEVKTPLDSTPNSIGFELAGGGATIEDLCVRRDIHYITGNGTASQSFEIPAGHYFAMGDNTQNSHDGRQWRGIKHRITAGAGSIEIVRDSNQDARRGMTDIYGETYDASPFTSPVIGEDNDSFHYVPRDFLLGKALAVFWPIYPTFRWKLIR
jgi:signal peptidase I